MSINNAPVYFEEGGKVNESTILVITTDGVNAVSVVIEAFDTNDNPCNFSNQRYTISVSHNGLEWTRLYDLLMGYEAIITNSFSYDSPMNAVLFFRYIKFSVPSVGENMKSRITISAR